MHKKIDECNLFLVIIIEVGAGVPRAFLFEDIDEAREKCMNCCMINFGDDSGDEWTMLDDAHDIDFLTIESGWNIDLDVSGGMNISLQAITPKKASKE